MATIRDVAKAAGVSVATASRALNGLSNVTRETREKIEAAAAALDYIPHSGARSLTKRTTDTIGVILPDLFGEYFSEVIRGVDQTAEGAGKSLLLSNMHGDPAQMGQAIRAMRGRVDALLLMPPQSDAQTIGDALAKDIPTVLLNAPHAQGTVPFVAVDNHGGARMVTQHLVDRGARNIVHLAGPVENQDAQKRKRGFCEVMGESLGEADPFILQGDFRDDAGRRAARMLIESGKPCDAVFCANDLMAVEMMSELREAGIDVGREIMVAGFDDIPMARYVTPRLTTVHSDIERLGAAAADMALRMLQGEVLTGADGVTLEPTLAIRGSSEGKRGD